MGKRKVIVVDGSNVAFEERSERDKAKISNLIAMRRLLEEKGYDPIVIVDASLKYEVDDPNQLEALIDRQEVRQVPAGTDADYFVIQLAEQRDAQIVTNDRYRSYLDQHPKLGERLVPFMIVEGQVQLYERDLQKAG